MNSARIARRAIGGVHGYVGIIGQVGFGSRRQIGIDLAGDNSSSRSHHLGYDRGVVAHAAAQVEDTITSLQFEHIDAARQEARLAVVQVAFGIDRYQHVVVEMSGVVDGPVGCLDEQRVAIDNLPGSGTEKLLSWDMRKSLDESRRVEIGRELDFLGVETATLFEGRHENEYN